MSEFPNSAHQVIEQADPTDPHPEATLCPRSTTVATPPIHIAEHFTTLENVRNGLEIGRKVWEDPVFPASDATLFYIKKRPDYLPPRVDWKRPTELSKRPQMVTMGVTRFDVPYFKEVSEIAGSSPPSPRSPPTLPLRQSYWRDPEF